MGGLGLFFKAVVHNFVMTSEKCKVWEVSMLFGHCPTEIFFFIPAAVQN